MQRISFAAHVAGHPDRAAAEASQWHHLLCEYVTASEIVWPAAAPFTGVFDVLRLGSLDLVRMRAPAGCSEASETAKGAYALVYNHASLPITYRNGDREVRLDRGEATLLRFDRPLQARREASPDNEWRCVIIPRRRLLDALDHADDLVGELVPANNGPLAQLKTCMSALLDSGTVALIDQMAGHLDEQVFNLAVSILGGGDIRMPLPDLVRSGVRLARREAVLSEIANGYRDPALTVTAVARKLGLSRRYVFALLHESGIGFSSRVLELRLQAALAMLQDPGRIVLRIGQVAYDVGFNEISHFNRCFRRRFGMTPTAARAAACLPPSRLGLGGMDRTGDMDRSLWMNHSPSVT